MWFLNNDPFQFSQVAQSVTLLKINRLDILRNKLSLSYAICEQKHQITNVDSEVMWKCLLSYDFAVEQPKERIDLAKVGHQEQLVQKFWVVHRYCTLQQSQVEEHSIGQTVNFDDRLRQVSTHLDDYIIRFDNDLTILEIKFERLWLDLPTDTDCHEFHGVFVFSDCSHDMLLFLQIELHIQKEYVVLNLKLKYAISEMPDPVKQYLEVVLFGYG